MEWAAIEKRLNSLLEAGRHGELRGAMMMLNEVDIAQYMETLNKEQLLLVFRILPKDISADVFSYMSAEQKQTLIESIGDSEIRTLIDDMFLDDAVDFLEELPASVVKRVLQNADTEKRNLIKQFLAHDGFMHIGEYFILRLVYSMARNPLVQRCLNPPVNNGSRIGRIL